MKDIMLNTLQKIAKITNSMPMPVYLGFITTENRVGYGEVFISSKPITRTGISHVFKLERESGLGFELREFMSSLSLYPKAVNYEGYIIDLDKLYIECRNEGKSVLDSLKQVESFVHKYLPIEAFQINYI
ncbi:TPA: hypothetical protein ACHCID_003110 [Vibrio parahaemolyticus]